MTFSETLSLQCLRTALLSMVVSYKESRDAMDRLWVENHSQNVKTAGSQWVNNEGLWTAYFDLLLIGTWITTSWKTCLQEFLITIQNCGGCKCNSSLLCITNYHWSYCVCPVKSRLRWKVHTRSSSVIKILSTVCIGCLPYIYSALTESWHLVQNSHYIISGKSSATTRCKIVEKFAIKNIFSFSKTPL